MLDETPETNLFPLAILSYNAHFLLRWSTSWQGGNVSCFRDVGADRTSEVADESVRFTRKTQTGRYLCRYLVAGGK